MGRTPRVRALHSDASRARLALGDLDADVAENANTGTRKKRRSDFGNAKSSSREPAFVFARFGSRRLRVIAHTKRLCIKNGRLRDGRKNCLGTRDDSSRHETRGERARPLSHCTSRATPTTATATRTRVSAAEHRVKRIAFARSVAERGRASPSTRPSPIGGKRTLPSVLSHHRTRTERESRDGRGRARQRLAGVRAHAHQARADGDQRQ